MMLKYLIEKEFKQIFRNSFIPKLFVAMPVMMMLVLPWAANQEVRNIKLSIVDNDHSVCSQRLASKIAASDYFTLTDVSSTYQGAMRSISSGDADIILEIPTRFERDLVNGNSASVMISANSVNGTKGGLGSSYLSSILSDYSSDLRSEQGFIRTSGGQSTPSFSVSTQYRFNPHLDYKVFMVPALMVVLLTLFAGFLPALNIAGEKEAGTIEQINVTPVKKLTFVAAKLIPYWIIGFVMMLLCMGLGVLVYGIYIRGSLFTILLFASVYILVMSGFGLVVSNYSDTMQQAVFVMFFFMMIFMLMSGLFTPVESMPSWAQAITIFNPLKYFIQVMRLVYLKSSSFSQMIPQFSVLCVFAAALNSWAVLSYKKKE